MKTTIFNMSFTLPPMVEITEVEKDMPNVWWLGRPTFTLPPP